ncbi:DUF317 domain-containing protein [Streptomyces sp. NPDC058773]|uniref:DUF317 domain-containing protein n=1 Tax=Streptomyces sp. NPDC058773 TaxID=3346632 RepID=UPI00368AF8D8
MTLSATAPFQAPAALPFATLGERERLLGCHCVGPVTDLLKDQGWDVISDLDSNVHCSSPDRRVYVGFLPERPAAARGELWHINVKGTGGAAAWHQSFGPDTPAQAVAGFLAALISLPSRYYACI